MGGCAIDSMDVLIPCVWLSPSTLHCALSPLVLISSLPPPPPAGNTVFSGKAGQPLTTLDDITADHPQLVTLVRLGHQLLMLIYHNNMRNALDYPGNSPEISKQIPDNYRRL